MSPENEERPDQESGPRGLVKHWLSSAPTSPEARGRHLFAATMIARLMERQRKE
jgi:hypothetical protein